jgi:hypothetical protein
MLGVPDTTIRHSPERLENPGFLEHTHKGASLSQWGRLKPECARRAQTYPEGKHHIGIVAALSTAGQASNHSQMSRTKFVREGGGAWDESL